jgi:hypothetical protein
MVHKRSEFAQKVHGLRAKLYAKKRHAEKVEMKKKYVVLTRPLLLGKELPGRRISNAHVPRFRIAMHQQKTNKHVEDKMEKGAVPAYLLDREQTRRYEHTHTHTTQEADSPSARHPGLCARRCWNRLLMTCMFRTQSQGFE